MKIENRKKAIADFAKLDPAICEKILPLKEQPEMISEFEKLTKLKNELLAVERKISVFYNRPSPAIPIPSAVADAAALLAGKPLEGQSVDTERQNLCRQRDGLAKAIEILRSRILETESKLIQEGCEKLLPVVQKYVGDTIKAFEELETALKNQEKFFEFLSYKGFRQGLRPSGWQTTDYEKIILFGFGGLSNLWSLPFWIEQRKKTWKLDGDKK
jgi:hypothetical protein